jgi:hypothetical protein
MRLIGGGRRLTRDQQLLDPYDIRSRHRLAQRCRGL